MRPLPKIVAGGCEYACMYVLVQTINTLARANAIPSCVKDCKPAEEKYEATKLIERKWSIVIWCGNKLCSW